MQEETINNKIFISIILPCYNEEAILEINVNTIVDYLENYNKYEWEIVIIDDGSADKTGEIADRIEKNFSNINVIHHPINLNLGKALQTGFCNTKQSFNLILHL